jgi:tetratricopeptide (TPR) repeat protein
VHIDGRGQVRSLACYRAIEAVIWGAVGGVTLAVTVVYGALFGLSGVLVGAGLAGFLGLSFRRGRMLQRATVLLAHDRLDEAEALLRKLVDGWPRNRVLRALAEQNLGAVAARRGDFEGALAHQRAALLIYSGSRRRQRSPMARLCQYAEVITLVNLGRVGEARHRLDEREKEVPRGDYLRLQFWVAELYVCLGEDAHRLDGDALHERARTGLAITGAAALLGLCAWAQWKSGDSDLAWHLLREALDRREEQNIERLLPRLHEWMEAHAAEARSAADD